MTLKVRRFCASRKRKVKKDEKKLIKYVYVEDRGMKLKIIT